MKRVRRIGRPRQPVRWPLPSRRRMYAMAIENSSSELCVQCRFAYLDRNYTWQFLDSGSTAIEVYPLYLYGRDDDANVPTQLIDCEPYVFANETVLPVEKIFDRWFTTQPFYYARPIADVD